MAPDGKQGRKILILKDRPQGIAEREIGMAFRKAAWATRAVSSGTGSMTCGWSDMRDILLLRGSRHLRDREPYYATACSPGAPCRGGIV